MKCVHSVEVSCLALKQNKPSVFVSDAVASLKLQPPPGEQMHTPPIILVGFHRSKKYIHFVKIPCEACMVPDCCHVLPINPLVFLEPGSVKNHATALIFIFFHFIHISVIC